MYILASLFELYESKISSLNLLYNSSSVIFEQRFVINVPFKHLSTNKVEGIIFGRVVCIFKTYVGEQIIETIGNKLASGTVGINANYTLHNKDVYIDAYAKLNESNYFVNVTSVNDNKDIFSALKYVSGRNVSMKRTLRRTKIQS